jgi:D-beta-D-heptose 7-phosphate kinase/D-beta-D-heptose 1-phosphate adenosyltransferase
MNPFKKSSSSLGGRRPLSLGEALSRREELRVEQKSLALTNGCFDLLHVGHVFLLEKTSALADELWVAVNSDASVRSLKGNNRPIQGELERAYTLLCLEFVDAVILFHGERLDQEIRALQPDVYAKGGDYSIDTIDAVEHDALQQAGTRIQFISFLDGYGTTDLIRRIKELPDD